MWIQLACAFRYGREDLDVIGVSFRKDIWIKRIQMYPFEGTKTPNTPMQDALLKKAGDQGHAFTFDVNSHLCIKHWKNNQWCPSLVSLLFCIRFQHIFHAQCPFNQHQRMQGRYSSRKTCTCANKLKSRKLWFPKIACLLLQPCGVDYEVKAYITNEDEETDEKVDKKYVLLHFNIKILAIKMNTFLFWFQYFYQ